MPDARLYDSHYGNLSTDPHLEVRRETWDTDLGQASWLNLSEALEWFRLLKLGAGQAALEVACGSGGITCRMALETGATCVGVDINPHGIEAAKTRAQAQGLAARVSFRMVDAGKPLPFPHQSVDAVFCNDSINHLPGRPQVLKDWHRILKPGGRVLYTDPIVVTGQLTADEMRARSSIGFFLFTPPGQNERLLAECGFALQAMQDVTEPVATIAWKWRDARARRRDALVALEGEREFENTQHFLDLAHTLAAERRLSRFLYLATRS